MVESRIDDFARRMRRGVRIKRMVTKWFTPTWGTTGAQIEETARQLIDAKTRVYGVRQYGAYMPFTK